MMKTVKEEQLVTAKMQQSDIQKKVLVGLEQIATGKTKSFDEVCDRLEKKYKNAAIYN